MSPKASPKKSSRQSPKKTPKKSPRKSSKSPSTTKSVPALTPIQLLNGIRTLVLSARQTVARGVDLLQVHTNYEIGRRIFEQEQQGANRAKYGLQLIRELADSLSQEFGSGFSETSLKQMRRFYLAFPDRLPPIGQTVSAQFKTLPISIGQTVSAQFKKKRLSAPRATPPITQTASEQSPTSIASEIAQTLSGLFTAPTKQKPFTLSWSHYVFLLGLSDPERSFYEIEATDQNWTLRELRRQFDAGLYERLALSRNPVAIRSLAAKGQQIARPQDILKEPYILEFLGLEPRADYSESDLESAIVTHVERFLLELGKGFLFEARQRRFTFDEEHFFIDLVLYNRLLRCYVLIDLKIGKLTHQDLGQMQMYVNYFDREIKTPAENSTVGIILCKKNQQALVEITLPKDANIHAREYQLYLPSKEELQQKLAMWIAEQNPRS